MGDVIRRWVVFIRERFPPATNVTIGVLLAATAIVLSGGLSEGIAARLPVGWIGGQLAIILGYCLFLLKLRVMDEIKDFESDLTVYPDRPLARGLISLREARLAVVILYCLELGVTLPAGWPGLAAWGPAAVFSYLMYREFFSAQSFRKSLFPYALAHAPSAFFATVWIASASTSTWPWALDLRLYLYGLSLIPVALAYEVSRKTFAPTQEIRGRLSYSSFMSIRGAARLVCLLLWACCLLIVLTTLHRPHAIWSTGLVGGVLCALTATLIAAKRARTVQIVGTAWFPLSQILVLIGAVL